MHSPSNLLRILARALALACGQTFAAAAISALRVDPKGTFVADTATPDPSFTIRFWICVE